MRFAIVGVLVSAVLAVADRQLPFQKSRNLLIAGSSGYFGGTILHKILHGESFPQPDSVYALVRSEEQASILRRMGVTPIVADLTKEPKKVIHAIQDFQINFIINNAIYDDWTQTEPLIKGLAQRSSANSPGYFITTSAVDSYMQLSGCELPSNMTDLDDIAQWEDACRVPYNSRTVAQNIRQAAGDHVRVYTVSAPLIFGQGLGFGHRISVQIPALVNAARKNKLSRYVPPGSHGWSVCHVQDLADLFLKVYHLAAMDVNETGYYFAETGHVGWRELSDAIAHALFKLGQVKDDQAYPWADLRSASQDLGFPDQLDFVEIIWSGQGVFRGERGRRIGWKPKYNATYLMSHLHEEIAIIDKEARV